MSKPAKHNVNRFMSTKKKQSRFGILNSVYMDTDNGYRVTTNQVWLYAEQMEHNEGTDKPYFVTAADAKKGDYAKKEEATQQFPNYLSAIEMFKGSQEGLKVIINRKALVSLLRRAMPVTPKDGGPCKLWVEKSEYLKLNTELNNCLQIKACTSLGEYHGWEKCIVERADCEGLGIKPSFHAMINKLQGEEVTVVCGGPRKPIMFMTEHKGQTQYLFVSPVAI